jgi:hypothetical protein
MSPAATPSNLAELALEVRLAERAATFEEMSYACELEAMCAGKTRSRLEHVAAEIDLSPGSTRDVLHEWECRARLLGEAHVLLRALIPFEAQIRQLAGHSADLAA